MAPRYLLPTTCWLTLALAVSCSGESKRESGSDGAAGDDDTASAGSTVQAGSTSEGAGGASADAGSSAVAGAPTSGGSASEAGSPSAGSAPESGGRGATGGRSGTGGRGGTGGNSATGGRDGTGGVSPTGGRGGTGGSPATGGAPETGGAPATGGVCSGAQCFPEPRRCPASGEWDDGTPCDVIGSDWWPDPEGDTAGTHHTIAGAALTDLHAEHVTPYGGWFTYTSPATPEWGENAIVCWSTEESGLDTAAGMDAAYENGDCLEKEVMTREGVEELPFIVTSLQPGTTYYLRAAFLSWEGTTADQVSSHVIQLRTAPDPRPALGDEHPRLVATLPMLDSLRARYQAGDERTLYWVGIAGERMERAIDPNDEIWAPEQFAVTAGLFWHMTGDETYLNGARELLMNYLLPVYEDQQLESNDCRWAGSDLATVTDLIYSGLSTSERQRILDAMLEDDENESNQSPNFEDTDEMASFAHIQIVHGLTFLGSTDMTADSMQRLEAVFDHALRRWYGVMLVKARRAAKVYGLCDGTMDDGVDYARGTQSHWLESMWMLDNSGFEQDAYSEWVWNHSRTHDIYAVVPDLSGVVTFGDIEDDGLLPNRTQELDKWGWAAEGLQVCLLSKFGRQQEASYVRNALMAIREPDANDGRPHHWGLLCDDAAIGSSDYTQLPTAYHAQGFGLVFDRTDWSADASYLFYSAGWRAVDHNHDDVGHFSLWANGSWVTHELPEYAENADSHNVLLLGNFTQNWIESPSASRILRTETSGDHLFILTDMTSAYSYDFENDGTGGPRPAYDSVTRSLYWDKVTDRVVVYDRIVGGQDGTRTQNVRDGAAVTRLYDERVGERAEVLMVVNGVGELAIDDATIGVQDLVAFGREDGELL